MIISNLSLSTDDLIDAADGLWNIDHVPAVSPQLSFEQFFSGKN